MAPLGFCYFHDGQHMAAGHQIGIDPHCKGAVFLDVVGDGLIGAKGGVMQPDGHPFGL